MLSGSGAHCLRRDEPQPVVERLQDEARRRRHGWPWPVTRLRASGVSLMRWDRGMEAVRLHTRFPWVGTVRGSRLQRNASKDEGEAKRGEKIQRNRSEYVFL